MIRIPVLVVSVKSTRQSFLSQFGFPELPDEYARSSTLTCEFAHPLPAKHTKLVCKPKVGLHAKA